MTRGILIVFLALAFSFGRAQFNGGTADGFHASAPAFGPVNDQSVYCIGGNGDGFTFSSPAWVWFGDQPAYCSGGDGDGSGRFLTGVILLSDQPSYCSGGNSDGATNYPTAQIALGNGIWKGTTNTSWTEASNWTNAVIPDISINVLIPSTCPFYPSLTSTLAVNYSTGVYRCRGMVIESGGQLTTTTSLNLGGQMVISGSYTANNNSSNTFNIFSGGTLTLNPDCFVKVGNQSSGTGYSDLRVMNGGTLQISGGTLEVDDQLQFFAGSTFAMTAGSVFAHKFGEGSSYEDRARGNLYAENGATGSISGGIIYVCGKQSADIYHAVNINSPDFYFTGTSSLVMTNGISSNHYDADIYTIPGADLMNLTISKTGATVQIISDASINGDLRISPDAHLQVAPGVTVEVADSVIMD